MKNTPKSRKTPDNLPAPRSGRVGGDHSVSFDTILSVIFFATCVLVVSFAFSCVIIAIQGPSDRATMQLIRFRKLEALREQTAHFRNRTPIETLRMAALGSKYKDPSLFGTISIFPPSDDTFKTGGNNAFEVIVAGESVDKPDGMVDATITARVPVTLSVVGQPPEGGPRQSITTTYMYTTLDSTDTDKEMGREECPAYLSYINNRYDTLPLYTAFVHNKASALSSSVITAIAQRAKDALDGNRYNLTVGAPAPPPDYFTSAEPTSHAPRGLPGYFSLSGMNVFRCVDHVVDDCCKLDGEKMTLLMSLFDEGGSPSDREFPLGFKTSHPPGCVRTPCCAIFVVHRDRIRRHSKAFWQRLASYTAHVGGSCWQLEHFWHVLMGELPISGGVPVAALKKHTLALPALLGGNPWQSCNLDESVGAAPLCLLHPLYPPPPGEARPPVGTCGLPNHSRSISPSSFISRSLARLLPPSLPPHHRSAAALADPMALIPCDATATQLPK